MKPCPFCAYPTPEDVKAKYEDGIGFTYHIHCPNCGARGPWTNNRLSAREEWNVRNGGQDA